MSGEAGIVSQSRAAGWDAKDSVALAAVLVISAGLCLYRLAARSIWFDEAAAIAFARALELRPGHIFPDGGSMAAYHLFLKAWLGFGDSASIVRMPSVFFAASTAGVLYFLARKFFDRQLALIAALLLVTNASFVRYGQEARGYALEMLMVTAAWLALAVALERRATKWFLLYGLLAGGAVTVHMFAVFFIVAQVISLLFLERGQVPRRKVLIGLGVAALGAFPIFVVAARTGAGQISWIPPLSTTAIGDVFSFMAGMHLSIGPQGLRVVWLLSCAAGWAGGLVLSARTLIRRGRSWETWSRMAVFLWFVVPLGMAFAVSAAVQSLMVPRYFIALLPAGALLLGLAISRIRNLVTRYASLVLLVTLSLVGMVRVQPDTGETGWRDAVAYVMNETQPGDSVLFIPWFQRPLFDYYAGPMNAEPPPTAGTDRISGRVWLVSTPIVKVDHDANLEPSAEVSTLLRALGSYRVVSTRAFGDVGVQLVEVQGRSS